MQIKFLTLYPKLQYDGYAKAQAQYELLSMWQKGISKQYIKFIPKAKVIFQSYSFFDYPDQEKLNDELTRACGVKSTEFDALEIQYWWGGEQYPDFDALFKALAKQKRLMELTIEVEE